MIAGLRNVRLAAQHRSQLARTASLLVLVATLVGSASAVAQTKEDDDPPLPKFVNMVVPSADDLLRGRPVDWIVLLNGDVLEVELVPYRPNTLKTLQQQYDEVLKARADTIGPEERRRKLYDLQRLQVTLIRGGDEPDFLLETRFIDRIVYFEDLILRRASLLMDAGNLPAAFELLMYVDRRHRGWPDYNLFYERYLFLDASRLLERQQPESALVQFERLFSLNPKYAQLSERLGVAIDLLITAAIEEDDPRRARHFLGRLERLDAEHVVVQRWRNRLRDWARQVLTQASEAFAAQQHRTAVDLADRAARIWPYLNGLKDVHRDLTARYQVVHAGVVGLPGTPTAYPGGGGDDDRRRALCQIPLFEPDRLQDGFVRYRSAWIESWEPRDLGRELHFQLRPRRAPWESRPILTAGAIVDSLQARRSQGRESGDDRWAANVLSVTAESPWVWRMALSQTPLRVEGWLRVVVPLTIESQGWNTDLRPEAIGTGDDQRFVLAERTDDQAIFLRSRPQGDGVSPRQVAEVREHRYPDWERILQGLNRGEIDFAPTVEWRDLAALQTDNRFFVQQYALPLTHVILVNPRSRAMASGPLRRALLHALPREQLLQQQVLENTGSTWGRVVTGPFATSTYAYDARLAQPEYSLSLAVSLAATAAKEFGGALPALKLRAPGDAVVARVVPELQRHWRQVGITVERLPDDDASDFDLLYATVRLTEPYVDIWNLVAAGRMADWSTLQVLPHWQRQQLLDLERTVDWTAAVRLLHRIQNEFLVEARWLPLWEVDEFLIARRRITGLVNRPMHAYHNIERWTVQSWYPTEVP